MTKGDWRPVLIRTSNNLV